MEIIVALTGASGIIYGLKLIEFFDENNIKFTAMISENAKKVAKYELSEEELKKLFSFNFIEENEIDSSLASGSNAKDAMVIVPCSMKTLSSIAHGYASNAISRAADVMLKENKKLILVPRETPLNAIHLENMLKLAKLGAVILPAMPGFYHKPKRISELVDFIVSRILDNLGIENELIKRWSKKSMRERAWKI